MNNKIPNAVIKRMPKYLRCLGELYDSGIKKTSSRELSERANVTASQLRQDLNNFGGFGLQGYGYDVCFLYNEIKKILGLNRIYNLIIIGGGNIGQALANYTEFEKRGIFIRAIFDVNPRLIGMEIRGIKIYDIDTLETYAVKNSVDIAVIATPGRAAQSVSERIIKLGIEGIWNFSHTDIKTNLNAIVENVNLTDGIMTLLYKFNQIY